MRIVAAQSLANRLPGLEELWNDTTGDKRVCVAILDGAVDLTHPCFATSHISEIPTVVTREPIAGTSLEHGTHVASIVFGNHHGVVKGIAPGCQGLVIPIFGQFDNGEPVACSQIDLARAINLAIASGADIINISGGQYAPTGSAHPILSEAVAKCARARVLIVAAAGNQGCDCLHIPAALPSVLSVGAMDETGSPLDFSNWGHVYRENGILAPGVDIPGALTGGTLTLRTGTSYAAPVVSGVIALLMSAFLKRYGSPVDPFQVRDAILRSAVGCDQEATVDCRRMLAGRLDLSKAVSELFKMGVNAMGENEPILELNRISENESASLQSQSFEPNASSLPRSTSRQASVGSFMSSSKGLLPSDCGGGCSCASQAGSPPGLQLVYALGQLGIDFESEARRDSIAQSMGPVVDEHKVIVSPHGRPHDARQLLAYLKENPWDSASIIWTLSIDATPIYAILPAGPYAAAGHTRLQEFLADMLNGVERISVPGIVAGSVRLASGQMVPAIVPELRGMYSWTTDALVKSLIPPHPEGVDDATKAEFALEAAEVAAGVHNFLERVYFELRNLGQTPQDRAINFAATNAFNIETVFENAHKQRMDLDTIEVEPSPICRPESDCWDVKLMFFYPEKESQAARRAYRFTVDVSDVVPVTVGVMRTWMVR